MDKELFKEMWKEGRSFSYISYMFGIPDFNNIRKIANDLGLPPRIMKKTLQEVYRKKPDANEQIAPMYRPDQALRAPKIIDGLRCPCGANAVPGLKQCWDCGCAGRKAA